ncbi:unnamed protein product [Ixodes pacificus]
MEGYPFAYGHDDVWTGSLEGVCPAGTEAACNSDFCGEAKRDVTFWRPFTSQASEVTAWRGTGGSVRSLAAASVRLTPSANSAFRPVRVRRLQCTFCGVPFLNNGQLAGHIRIHTGDRPYKCGACSRAFARNEELTRHRRIHSGDKPHACDVCKKRFGRKDHLNKHRNTHLKDSEKKVYMCRQPGCGHKYTRTDALTRHQWTAHCIRKASHAVGLG